MTLLLLFNQAKVLDIKNPQIEATNYDNQIEATNYDNQVEINNYDYQIEAG